MRSRVRLRAAKKPALDPVASADVADLHHVDDVTGPGIRRMGSGKRAHYVDPKGRRVSSAATLQRIRALAIPPAWTSVWICPDPRGHLQATGRDARGRKQYRYHPRWREIRDDVKYGRLLAFATALPKIRARVAADLRKTGLSREKVLAAVVQLLERTLIRVGNEEYARENHSFGLTTMRANHARVSGPSVHFEFRGKSGVAHVVDLHDARLARIVKACRDLPGHDLFQYVDGDGHRHAIGSADVNHYLREVSRESFTAKDFRTWAGTVLAARALADASASSRSGKPVKAAVTRAIEQVAKELRNTTAVCRKSYVHPAVIDAYLAGHLRPEHLRARQRSGLSIEEAGVVTLLERQR